MTADPSPEHAGQPRLEEEEESWGGRGKGHGSMGRKERGREEEGAIGPTKLRFPI